MIRKDVGGQFEDLADELAGLVVAAGQKRSNEVGQLRLRAIGDRFDGVDDGLALA